MRATRRDFMKWVAASGISLGASRIALGQDQPTFLQRETLPGRGALNPAASGLGRIDGVAKVTGAKLYASDFRGADLPGWPSQTSHAILLRVPDATHIYEGLDLGVLDSARPSVVVTADDVARIGTRVPEFYAGDLFCPVGKTPLYLGQPAALLVFEAFDTYDRARVLLRDGAYLKFGRETGPVVRPNYGAWRFTRVAGPTPDSPDVYAPVMEGWVSPGFFESSGRPIWRPIVDAKGPEYVKGAKHGEEIRALLTSDDPSLLVIGRDFETQSIDPMALEPECGLAWYDADGRALEMVLGVQSPFEALDAVSHLLGEAEAPFRPERIDAQFAYVGGGFGGKDHTPFTLYVALAAVFYPGHAVRLAQDRYQQFQGGIKRHAFKMRSRMGVDRASGKIVAFAADHVLDGGGLANYSPSVAVVGATGALGIYEVPKVDVTTVALHSRGVTAGSMRGYGTLQTMTAIEVLVDEVARALPLDAIEFRRRNALEDGGRTMTGNRYLSSIRNDEVLDKLEAHPIWKERHDRKAMAQPDVVVGTGVACVTKDYGTGADASLSSVEIDPEGRIAIHSDAVEMGNGIGTALANRVGLHLGGIADEVTVCQVDVFGALDLVTSGNTYTMTQEAQDAAAADPRWVPVISSATAASSGAHVGTQPVEESARILYRFGLWPSALALWGIAADDPRAAQFATARWHDGELVMPGLRPLRLAEIAARLHADKGITGAMAHAFSRWQWSEATFQIHGQSWSASIDSLALRRGDGDYRRVDRASVNFPPATNNRIGTAFTSACGTLVRIEIERATGVVRIAKAYTVLECGHALVPEVVVGQAHGGFAMGVGYTFLETLPHYEDGPGNGRWNLGDYVIARGSDLPIHDFDVEVLPPLSGEEGPKGMAEVVMIPVVPALLNAVYDATGKRFESLPVTPAMLKGVIS